ncbi:hypothetical protein [Algoriphagus machipongonensis]|uniref:Uncharacterized protein n=1 Tax=Algoriphagus machipongonensis TaxID=388413 RepID=A3HYV6_9BACT|nr:hypothetical protein [Algoriphagus machipongonensis]EAZ80442.1 hypothetical protein ALPR1_05950 [Algoriphagus machipongonensis]
MKTILKIASYIALAMTIIPPIMYFKSAISLDSSHLYMTLGMLLWFGTAPFWINKKTEEQQNK